MREQGNGERLKARRQQLQDDRRVAHQTDSRFLPAQAVDNLTTEAVV